MKAKQSYAEAANKIIIKMKDERSQYTLNMYEDQLSRLMEKQEEERERQGLIQSNQSNQFEEGGPAKKQVKAEPTYTYNDLRFSADQRLEENLKGWEPDANIADLQRYFNFNYNTPTPTKTAEFKAKTSNWFAENGDTIMRGVTAAGGNLGAMAMLRDPEYITPDRINPIWNVDRYNSEPGATAIRNNLASIKHGLANKGAPFGEYTNALTTMAAKANEQIGLNDMEGQKINMAAMMEKSKLLSAAQAANVANSNQADIDFASQEINYNKEKRAYFTALADNLSGVFEEMGNKKLAKELGKDYAKYAKLIG